MRIIEFPGRKAPYAPVSALREFLERIRETATPVRVDRRFLQKLNIASNNEWALLSALKFLGIVDQHGVPAAQYRLLQTSDRYQETLRSLVLAAYKDLFDAGGDTMSGEDLTNYFRRTSSPSQARNAARFFQELCRLAALPRGYRAEFSPERGAASAEAHVQTEVQPLLEAPAKNAADFVLRAKATLANKLPPYHPEWSAEDYRAICGAFLAMMRELDG